MKVITCERKPYSAMQITAKTNKKHVADFTDRSVESKRPSDAATKPMFTVYGGDEIGYLYMDDWIVKDPGSEFTVVLNSEFKKYYNVIATD